jgi:alpha-tubulin suppressor-like RCC1 family protein
MPNQFFSPEGDLENYFVNEYWLIDQYIGDQLWIWGSDAYSHGLGIGVINSSRQTPVTTTAGGTNWKQVSLGYEHSAAIKTDGTLWTWGTARFLGNGDTTNNKSTPITTFAGGTDWKQITTSRSASFAIKNDGTLWTWGYIGIAGVNLSSFIHLSTPVTTFAGGTNWRSVSGGAFHVAAIKTDGTLWTWGEGGDDQLGNGSDDSRLTPVTTFAGGNDWKQVSPGRAFTAAIKTDGTLWTWGFNGFNPDGQLGTNDSISRSTPVTTFVGGTNWKQVCAGANHAAAIKTDGTLWTWGNSLYGQLGNGPLRRRFTPVTTFAGGNNWADTPTTNPEDLYTLNSAANGGAAIKTDGTLWIWGSGFSGQLGNNQSDLSYTPITVFSGGTNWKQISTSSSFVSAIKTDGTLWTWGSGINGRLGRYTASQVETPVTTFAGGNNWADTPAVEPEDLYTLSAGGNHTAAIKTDGTLWTWGNGINGQLGNSTPVTTFAGGTNWKQVSSGSNFTAVVKTDGTLWVWGEASNGKLGNNVLDNNKSTPVTTFAGGTNWKQVSAGTFHTSAIKTDGTLWTWGAGTNARLGTLSLGSRITPVTTFAGGNNWADTPTVEPEDLYTLSAGGNHTAAIKTDGTLWTWGNGINGQLGNASTLINNSTPVTTFAGGTNWKQVSSGSNFTAVVKTDGTLWTWGFGSGGSSGQLGNSQTIDVSTPITTFSGGTNWKQVSSGNAHTAAIKTDGTLWTWGVTGNGRLGNSSISGIVSTPVTTFAGGTDWKYVGCGNNHTTAVKTDGTLWVWGEGISGKLGNNAISNRSTPITTFAGGTNWKQASGGLSHSAAVKTDGTLWAWGQITFGQIGSGGASSPLTPVTTFAGGTDWKQVDCGNVHTAAIKTDGTLWTWGYNSRGELGINDLVNRSTPVTTFAGGTNWKQVSAFSFTMALRDDGVNKQLYVWGNTSNGRLGNSRTGETLFEYPIEVYGWFTNWKQVSSGNAHTAAIKTDGTLWTWGTASNGRLGNASLINRTTPVTTFAGGTDWKQVSCGDAHTVAIKTDGTLWTWGLGGNGQIGDASVISTRSTPITTFAGGTNWKQVSSGSNYTTAVKTDGTLWTWGAGNSGKLGNADTTSRSTPVTTFAGGTNWKQVSSGNDHTVALRDDGVNKQLYVWGNANQGRLGNSIINVTPSVFTPITTFAGGTNWKQVSSSGNHTTAVKTDGTLWTWGYGAFGRLGNADTTSRSTPITTFAGGTDWRQVSSGNDHTSAIKTDGTLWTWGYGTSGRLGNAVTTGNISTPVTTFAGGTNWKQVSSGSNFTAAVKTDGTLWTWGSNTEGQLGIFSFVVAGLSAICNTTTILSGTTSFNPVPNNGQRIITDGSGGILTNISTLILGPASLSQSTTPDFKNPSPQYAPDDDGFWELTLPFNISYNGVSYNKIYVSTNSYITFGTKPADDYDQTINWNYTTATPPIPKIQISTADRSAQRIYYGTEGTSPNRTYRVRFEGHISFQNGILGSPTLVWEMVFYENISNQIDIQPGINDDASGSFIGVTSTPITTFAGGTNWKQVSAGNNNTFAIKTDGTLWTWGYGGYGELGNGIIMGTDVVDGRVPTPITTFLGGTNWKQVHSSGGVQIALNDDGVNKRLYVWGSNFDDYELGLGNPQNWVPVEVDGNATNWKQVDGGYGNTAAIKTDGTLWTWGYNGDGQLGNNTIQSFQNRAYTPITTTAGGTNWKQVSFGRIHVSAVQSGINAEYPLS